MKVYLLKVVDAEPYESYWDGVWGVYSTLGKAQHEIDRVSEEFEAGSNGMFRLYPDDNDSMVYLSKHIEELEVDPEEITWK